MNLENTPIQNTLEKHNLYVSKATPPIRRPQGGVNTISKATWHYPFLTEDALKFKRLFRQHTSVELRGQIIQFSYALFFSTNSPEYVNAAENEHIRIIQAAKNRNTQRQGFVSGQLVYVACICADKGNLFSHLVAMLNDIIRCVLSLNKDFDIAEFDADFITKVVLLAAGQDFQVPDSSHDVYDVLHTLHEFDFHEISRFAVLVNIILSYSCGNPIFDISNLVGVELKMRNIYLFLLYQRCSFGADYCARAIHNIFKTGLALYLMECVNKFSSDGTRSLVERLPAYSRSILGDLWFRVGIPINPPYPVEGYDWTMFVPNQERDTSVRMHHSTPVKLLSAEFEELVEITVMGLGEFTRDRSLPIEVRNRISRHLSKPSNLRCVIGACLSGQCRQIGQDDVSFEVLCAPVDVVAFNALDAKTCNVLENVGASRLPRGFNSDYYEQTKVRVPWDEVATLPSEAPGLPDIEQLMIQSGYHVSPGVSTERTQVSIQATENGNTTTLSLQVVASAGNIGICLLDGKAQCFLQLKDDTATYYAWCLKQTPPCDPYCRGDMMTVYLDKFHRESLMESTVAVAQISHATSSVLTSRKQQRGEGEEEVLEEGERTRSSNRSKKAPTIYDS